MIRGIWQKYRFGIIITGLFVLFITFIAPNNLIESARIRSRISKMQKEQAFYREQARSDSTFLESLKDDEFLEKYARENFFLKRRGEEIYLLEE